MKHDDPQRLRTATSFGPVGFWLVVLLLFVIYSYLIPSVVGCLGKEDVDEQQEGTARLPATDW